MPELFFTLAAGALDATATPPAPAAQMVGDVSDALPWHMLLVDWTVTLCLIVICLGMIFCIYRLLRGPHIADRALSVDTLGIYLIALVVLLSLKFKTLIFFDGVLVLSLVGFAGTVAMAQYIGRPHLKKGTGDAAVNPTLVPHDHPQAATAPRQTD